MKDYHDLYLITRAGKYNAVKLVEAIKNTLNNRKTLLKRISFSKQELVDIGRIWAAHLRGLGCIAKELDLPATIEEVIETINKVVTQTMGMS